MRKSGYLDLSHGHKMYYELHGNPKGKPVVILHGGPGGGIMHKHLDHFDLRKWNIIMFDQRGCGKSTPFGLESLEHNKTEYLVEDIECLREHLNISQWYVFGGSWGTILGILYAESYPENVSGLLLRSICTLEPSEYEWLYEQKGAGQLYPKEWAEFISVINGPYTYKSIIANYRKLLTSKDSLVRQKAVNHWYDWENAVSFLLPKKPEKSYKKKESIAIIENHYFFHNAWLKPNQLFKNAKRLLNIPITIVHGRYDLVCPINASFEFKKVAPHDKLFIITDAGHASREPGTSNTLRHITNTLVSKYLKTRKRRS